MILIINQITREGYPFVFYEINFNNNHFLLDYNLEVIHQKNPEISDKKTRLTANNYDEFIIKLVRKYFTCD